MKIAVLADQQIREEIRSKKTAEGAEWVWVDTLAEMKTIPRQEVYFDLNFKPNEERIAFLAGLLPSTVVVDSVSHVLQDMGQPFIRINGWPGFIGRPLCEIAVGDEPGRIKAKEIFYALHWPCRFVPDLPGMVSPRILSMIINEAYFTFGAGISTKQEIDLAMKWGTNYPLGPFEWAEKIGLGRIYDLLRILSKMESRYTISGTLIGELNQ